MLILKEIIPEYVSQNSEFEELDKKTAKKLGLEEGIKVKKLYAGKLSKHTEMKEGFIITKVDRRAMRTVEDLANALEGKDGGVLIEGVYEDLPGIHYYAFGLEQ